MTESITSSTLFNSFAVFREIFKSITALSTLNSHWGVSTYYFEDLPNVKAANFVGFPIVIIETSANQESLTIKDKKQMMYITTVTFYTDASIEKEADNLNGYLNAVVYWFNNNKNTLRYTYGLWGLSDIEKIRGIEIIAQKELIAGTLIFNYHVTLNMTA